MDRLTKIIDGKLVFPSELVGVIMTPSNDTMCQILTRLAAYEDTGLEPEEINRLCDMDRRAKMADLLRLEEYQDLGPIGHLRELIQAEKDGLLIADAFIFLIVGIAVGMHDVVKRLQERGWTIEPPEEGTV